MKTKTSLRQQFRRAWVVWRVSGLYPADESLAALVRQMARRDRPRLAAEAPSTVYRRIQLTRRIARANGYWVYSLASEADTALMCKGLGVSVGPRGVLP